MLRRAQPLYSQCLGNVAGPRPAAHCFPRLGPAAKPALPVFVRHLSSQPPRALPRQATSATGRAPYSTHAARPRSRVEDEAPESVLSIELPPVDGEGVRRKASVDALRLRDACPCSLCVDPDSGQKTFATTDLPGSPQVRSYRQNDDGSVSVAWADDPLSGGDGSHESVYPLEVLRRVADCDSKDGADGYLDGKRRTVRRWLWDRTMLQARLPEVRVSYADWTSGGGGFWDALAELNRTGVVLVHGVPDSERAVEVIGEQIGHLQRTFYGLTWDVISKPKAENVAYTNHFLGLHQDLLYHYDCPRIQILHCLANDCDGGESLFSDGVRAALRLEADAPDLYHALTTNSVGYHYDKHGYHYSYARPTIPDGGDRRPLPGVWWSPPFQDVFPRGARLREWHAAARAFQALLESEDGMCEYKLAPGECVVFDNWRVLHGRRHFNTAQGKRWLKGTYVSDQVFRGRTTQLAAEHDTHWAVTSDSEAAADEWRQVAGGKK